MRPWTLIVLMTLPHFVAGQTFAEEMNRCAEAFHRRFAQAEPQHILDVYHELGRCVEGHELPPFTVTDLAGQQYDAAALTDKVVWINFWFIACPPCAAELPIIEEIYQRYKDRQDFVLLTLAIDKPQALEQFALKKQLHYPIVPQSESIIQDTLHMTFDFFPTNIFIDKQGKIIKFKPGGPVDAAGIQQVKKDFIQVIDTALQSTPK